MRTLVTGGTGFTGGHLCRRLLRAGHHVQALVRDPRRAETLSRWGAQLVQGDLRDPPALRRAVENCDVVYHIAAAFRQEDLTARQMREINAGGTRNLLEAAEAAGVGRFVHCSTVGVHGETRNGPADEESPCRPGDRYQRSKVEGERIVRSFINRGRMPIVIFRPGGIYGPGDLRFLKLFRAIDRGRFIMLGSGEILYQLIYIDDLIDGILACGAEQRAVGRIYILTGERPVTLNRLVNSIADVLGVDPPRLRFPVTPVYLAGCLCELLCKPLGISPPVYRRRVDFFRKSRSFDISRAQRELGFQPKTDLRTGLGLTADWYRKQGYLASA
jgi:nucleoside-diphosphate-sugar epimerase